MLDTGILGATLQDLPWFPGSLLWRELWTLKYNQLGLPELSSRVIQLYGWLHFRTQKGLSPVESRSNTWKYYLPAISVLQFNILRTPIEILPPSLCNCPARQLAVWANCPHLKDVVVTALTALGILAALFFSTGLFVIMASRTRSSVPGSTAKSSHTETLFDFSGQTQRHYNTRY